MILYILYIIVYRKHPSYSYHLRMFYLLDICNKRLYYTFVIREFITNINFNVEMCHAKTLLRITLQCSRLVNYLVCERFAVQIFIFVAFFVSDS